MVNSGVWEGVCNANSLTHSVGSGNGVAVVGSVGAAVFVIYIKLSVLANYFKIHLQIHLG